MWRRGGLVVILAVLLAGCGSRQSAPSTPQSFLLRSGEQPGYSVTSAPSKIRLTQPGFKTGVQESLGASRGRGGFTVILEFTSAGAARASAEETHYLKVAKAGAGPLKLKEAAFAVPGVPGARGFTAQGGPVGLADAYWTVGRCMLGSGVSLPDATGKSAAALAAPVIAGIQSQSKRIAGHCP
jgi:hypothetical protein